MSDVHDRDWLASVRADLPVTAEVAYLNTGTAGPLPAPTAESLRADLDAELAHGRAGMAGFERLFETIGALRSAMCRLVGAPPGSVALTHHTTEGVNVGVWGLDLGAADEVVTTTVEHEGVVVPLAQLHHRRGTRIRFADVGVGSGSAAVEAVAAEITDRTRLVVVSHVAFSTGALLPVREIAAAAHAVGALVVVDGAQSVGAIPVDVDALDADVYAFPGQKWLCGIEGMGGVYVRPELVDRILPIQVGFFSVDLDSYRHDDIASHRLAEGARRYEVGTVFRPGLSAMLASLTWLEESVGLDRAFARISSLAAFARAEVGKRDGFRLVTPGEHAGLVSFHVDGLDPVDAVARLAADGIVIRSIPDTDVFRISCGFFTTEDEVFAALDGLARLRGAG